MSSFQSPAGVWRRIARIGLVRLIAFFALLAASDVGAQLSLHYGHRVLHGAQLPILIGALALCAAMLGLYLLLVHLFERRTARELALHGSAPLLFGGVAFGFALFTTVYAVLGAMGVAQWQGLSGHAPTVMALASALIAAIGEELTVRGGVFRILEDSFGTAVALILSAALFGALHMANPGATTVSTTAIALEAGILLGAAYAASRSLWLPIGLHFGWNFTEGGIYGATVSGGKVSHSAFNVSLSGPDLLTGGTFGPEASIIAVGVCLVAALVLIVMTVRRGHWRPLAFRLMLD